MLCMAWRLVVLGVLFLITDSARFTHAQVSPPQNHGYLNKKITIDPKVTDIDDYLLEVGRKSGQSVFIDTTDFTPDAPPINTADTRSGFVRILLRAPIISHRLSIHFAPYAMVFRKMPDIAELNLENLTLKVDQNNRTQHNRTQEAQALQEELARLIVDQYKRQGHHDNYSFTIPASQLSLESQKVILRQMQQGITKGRINSLSGASLWFKDEAWNKALLFVQERAPNVVMVQVSWDSGGRGIIQGHTLGVANAD